MHIPIKRFDNDLPLPEYQPGSACFDLVCRETVTIGPREIKAVHQNIALQVPEGHALLLFGRSSTGYRKGLMMANSVGVIDPKYRGDRDEIMAMMFNITDKPVTVKVGDKIIQGMIIKTEPVTWQEAEKFNDEGHGGYQH